MSQLVKNRLAQIFFKFFSLKFPDMSCKIRIMKICKVQGCGRKYYAKGYCIKHYEHFRVCGTPFARPRIEICTVEGCNQKHYAKGYCSFHLYRKRHNIPFELSSRNVVKGARNGNWKGGIAEYPNHSLMKKNRLIKIEQQNGKCELCGDKASKIHHKDLDKSNHNLDNLILVCNKCHGKFHAGQSHIVKTSKWIRLYGMNFNDLCKKLECSYYILRLWHKNNLVKYLLATRKILTFPEKPYKL